jgi:two-component system phosphate regulon sensor histidine kinase PhoR
MNRRLFIFVIILMGISLGGIILFQLFWIRNAINIREEQFNKAVNTALRETADKLEKQENMWILNDRISSFSAPRLKLIHESDSNTLFLSSDSAYAATAGYQYNLDANSNYVVNVWNDDNENEIIEYKYGVKIDSIRDHVDWAMTSIDIDSLSEFLTHDIIFVGDDKDSLMIHGSEIHSDDEKGYVIVRKAQNLSEAFIKLAYEIETNPVPITKRINEGALKGILTAEMFNKGIYPPFEFGVMNVDSLRSFPIASPGFDTLNISKEYVVSIFPNELLSESNFLVMQFPGRNIQIIRSMFWPLAGSLLLTLIILTTFGITIFMILRQKKLSDIKSDFINNMTHEFKTPIATISLATDSIANPKIIGNEKEVRYYTDIIREENQRMNNQVESVLRMSLLDKHELEFNFIDSDIHCLIEKAVAKLSLQLEDRKAKVDLKLNAKDPMVYIDPDHFTNAILNLIDNALKYSEEDPAIMISTSDTAKGIAISVSDNGMGMSREVQARIFDKFYRKPSGNIHNIKGFGLGLSYVKAIMDAFGGNIRVHSEPGKGTTFIMEIPKK